MSEVKKLTTEELDSVKQIRQEYSEISTAIGDLELQLSNLNKEKQRLLSLYDNLTAREVELAKQLQEKYGSGSINLETGVVS